MPPPILGEVAALQVKCGKVLVGDARLYGAGRISVIMIVFVVFIPLRDTTIIAREFVVVDVRPYVVRLVVAANQAILLINEQTLVIVPRIDAARGGVRRALETAALAGLARDAEAVGEKVFSPSWVFIVALRSNWRWSTLST